MVNELRDLDGDVLVRARALPDEPPYLRLTSTDTGATLDVQGLEAIQTLRDLCEDLLQDSTED